MLLKLFTAVFNSLIGKLPEGKKAELRILFFDLIGKIAEGAAKGAAESVTKKMEEKL